MSKETPRSLPLRAFWRTFARYAPAWSRLPLPYLPSLLHGLNAYFGELTSHTLLDAGADELRIQCLACKNAMGELAAEVCETHLGVIEGTAQTVVGEVFASHEPHADGTCLVVVRKRPAAWV